MNILQYIVMIQVYIFKSDSFDIIVDDTIKETHEPVHFFKTHLLKVDKEIF